jgi:hypothetical protein
MVTSGATDCARCGHVFTPGIDCPSIRPWWVIELLGLSIVAAYLFFAVRSAYYSGVLRVPTKRDVLVLEQTNFIPWLWWLMLALLLSVGVAAAARVFHILLMRLRRHCAGWRKSNISEA